ncbi:peptidyl-prolyl cis-trans isomerase [Desulfovibrio litoralis]|uniref:Periplasmic chaperone for outer membrane proteins SurA n=1 Tax=Desulfovibrio litoralis DSM 11393 TaxID=1121455 RepID=A0A1M7RVX9_9BACT|nr:peptidyl-prolyl cis-trans isomerase [Desulfovibrio litoralis]SHN50316.1 periplasmic chaperone for outer membrane proteins SurA [Desulfovibrio litoralis DSM 11393]
MFKVKKSFMFVLMLATCIICSTSGVFVKDSLSETTTKKQNTKKKTNKKTAGATTKKQGTTTKNQGTTTKNQGATTNTSLNDDKFLVTKIGAVVNGEMISLYDIQTATNSELARLRITPADPRYDRAVKEIMRRSLDNKINDILLRQEAERLKITVSPQDIDNELKSFIKRSQMTEEQFEKELKAKGENMAFIKDKMRDNILTKRIISYMISRKVSVTEKELEEHYEKNKDQYIKGKVVDVSLLLFPPNINAEKVLADIRSGKLKFADAVAKFSIGPNPKKSGVLGKLPWEEMATDWKDIIAPMSVGEISKIFDVRNFKAIVKLNSMNPGVQMTFEEAKPIVDNEVRTPLLNARFDEYLAQLKSKAIIDIKL